MDNESQNPKQIQEFSPAVNKAYEATHDWLESLWEAQGYTKEKINWEEQDLKSVASQFYTYFPAHFFKVVHSLDNIIGTDKLSDWIHHTPRFCLIDIGCGAGAATIAFLDVATRLSLSVRSEIFCVGVDPNPYALAVYHHMMLNYSKYYNSDKMNFDHKIFSSGIPKANSDITSYLEKKRIEWNLPGFAHAFLMQVNVVSPLSKVHEDCKVTEEILENLGVPQDRTAEEQEFGAEEARAYHSLFRTNNIDNLHILTVGTDQHRLDIRVGEMGKAIQSAFSSHRHKVAVEDEGVFEVKFKNPVRGRFSHKPPHSSKFHANIITITNEDLRTDEDWQNVIDLDNLKAAWAKTRAHFLRDSLADEIELRQFEQDLEGSLVRVRGQLIAYADDVAHSDEMVAYKVPKNSSSARPRGLSHIEEELISTAIIQKLGRRITSLQERSYAYRVNSQYRGRDTEFLYKPYLHAYKDYIEAARSHAARHSKTAVLRADIKSFYTKIEQSKLEALTQKLTHSERVKWLIRLLLSKNLDEHEVGKGLVQGSISSGFYANIYLRELDQYFGEGNEWNVQFFRYVDDMIFVFPPSNDETATDSVIKEVKERLVLILARFGLQLNEDKTGVSDANDFLVATQPDQLIERLNENFEKIFNKLWVTNEKYRAIFINAHKKSDSWWHHIRLYRHCLKQLGIFVDETRLSRWIHRYLFDKGRRGKDLKRERELNFPTSLDKTMEMPVTSWYTEFSSKNSHWMIHLTELKKQLIIAFQESYRRLMLPSSSMSPDELRRSETRLRFTVGKLSTIGFGNSVEKIIDILKEKPWLLRETSYLMDALAEQGHSGKLREVLKYYKVIQCDMSDYLKAMVIRSLRFSSLLDHEEWGIITQHATTGSLVERLMATETWLYLSNHPLFQQQSHFVTEIAHILADEKLHPKVIKNYELLIEEYDGNSSNLFNYEEPDLILYNYYGGRYEDEADYRGSY